MYAVVYMYIYIYIHRHVYVYMCPQMESHVDIQRLWSLAGHGHMHTYRHTCCCAHNYTRICHNYETWQGIAGPSDTLVGARWEAERRAKTAPNQRSKCSLLHDTAALEVGPLLRKGSMIAAQS